MSGERKPGDVTGKGFKPGQSGNPGGRTKGAEARAKAVLDDRGYTDADGRVYTGPAAMVAILRDIAYDKTEKTKDRIEAANKLLDRIEGKPITQIAGSLDVGMSPDQQAIFDALKLSPEERRKRMAEIGDEPTG